MLTITLNVEGMMCQNCEKHVNKAVESNFAVQSVTSDHEKNETVIVCSEKPDMERLKAVIAEEGYTVVSEKVTEA